jgi:hypothetical protein
LHSLQNKESVTISGASLLFCFWTFRLHAGISFVTSLLLSFGNDTASSNLKKKVDEFFCLLQVAASHCKQIAELRHRFQHMSKSRLLFLDETAVRLSEAATSTLVAPGEKTYVVVSDTTSYARRFDMIACINGDKTFAPVIYSPKDTSSSGVKGINTEMLIDYIYSTLGQETAALDNPLLTLVLDLAAIHNEERTMEAFRERGGHVMQLVKMPAQAGLEDGPVGRAPCSLT